MKLTEVSGNTDAVKQSSSDELWISLDQECRTVYGRASITGEGRELAYNVVHSLL